MSNVRRNPGSVDLADTAYYSGAALPSAGDSLFFTEGSDALVTNMSALAAIDLAVLAFTPQCKSTCPTTAMSITCDRTNTGVFRYEGAATGTLKFIGGSDNDVWKIQWLPASGARGEFDAMDILGDLEVFGGSCYVGSTALFGASSVVWALGGDTEITATGSDAVPTINAKRGARITVRRAFTTLNVEAGATVTLDLDAYTGGTVNMNGDCTVNWLSGTVTTLNHYDGLLDISKFRRVGQEATNYNSSPKARVLANASSTAQPTLGASSTSTVGGRSASVMFAGTGGGTSFGAGG